MRVSLINDRIKGTLISESNGIPVDLFRKSESLSLFFLRSLVTTFVSDKVRGTTATDCTCGVSVKSL